MRMHQTICSAFILREQSNLVVGARSLVRIMTLACGAGGPGFKSQRARHSYSHLMPKTRQTPSS